MINRSSSSGPLYSKKDPSLAQTFIHYLALGKNIMLDPTDKNDLGIIMDDYVGQIEMLRIMKERAQGNYYNGYDEALPSGRMSRLLSPRDEHREPTTEELISMHIPRPATEEGKTAIWASLPHGLEFHKTQQETMRLCEDWKKQSAAKEAEAQKAAEEEFTQAADELLNSLAAISKRKSTAEVQPQTVPALILPPGITKALSLKNGIALYLQEKQLEEKLTPKTAVTRRTMLSVLCECFGEDRMLYVFLSIIFDRFSLHGWVKTSENFFTDIPGKRICKKRFAGYII